jgi:hypothetical protein
LEGRVRRKFGVLEPRTFSFKDRWCNDNVISWWTIVWRLFNTGAHRNTIYRCPERDWRTTEAMIHQVLSPATREGKILGLRTLKVAIWTLWMAWMPSWAIASEFWMQKIWGNRGRRNLKDSTTNCVNKAAGCVF